jgi:hypothetical protein
MAGVRPVAFRLNAVDAIEPMGDDAHAWDPRTVVACSNSCAIAFRH